MTTQNHSLIAEIFQQLLDKNDINAYQLAKEANIDRTYLSKLFSGVIAKPGKHKLVEVAEAFGIELKQLQLVLHDPEAAIQELGLENLDLSKNVRSKQDWGAAPNGILCYEREAEIKNIQQLVDPEYCRIVNIFGLGGIGKTTIAMELAKRLENEFDYVLWRTLSNVSLPEMIIQDALKLFTKKKHRTTISQQIAELLQYFRNHRCLIILDQVENILATGNSLEVYQNGYQIYGELFRQIAQTQHQTCLLLIGNEKPKNIAIWESSSTLIQSLQIQGSTKVCYQILKDKGAIKSPAWDELIEAYHAHPLAIKIVASMIKELFAGDVSEFLRQNTLFLGDLEFILHQQYNRLGDLEQYVLNIIAQMEKPLSLQELSEQYATKLRCSQIMDCLNSLKRRSLIEIVAKGKSFQKNLVLPSDLDSIDKINFYSIQPIVRKYITSQT